MNKNRDITANTGESSTNHNCSIAGTPNQQGPTNGTAPVKAANTKE